MLRSWQSLGWDAIKNRVPVARESLENEFRKLRGATNFVEQNDK
jgi:hypothetical protein